MAKSRNLSVQQFQDLMASFPREIARDLDSGVFEQAERLANSQRAAVKVGKTGNLKKSIKVEKGRRALSYRVVAGGELTTKEVRKGSGVSYDYARALEFGSMKSSAQPFFWPTYRLLKTRLRSGIAKKAKSAIGRVVNLDKG